MLAEPNLLALMKCYLIVLVLKCMFSSEGCSEAAATGAWLAWVGVGVLQDPTHADRPGQTRPDFRGGI